MKSKLTDKINRLIFLNVLPLTLIFSPNICYAGDLVNFMTCRYTQYSDASGIKKVSGEFILDFLIDKEKSKFYMRGNQGIEEINGISSIDGINFIEITAVGNLMLTTIDNYGNSVHSRHTIISEKIVPSQYYGTCSIKSKIK